MCIGRDGTDGITCPAPRQAKYGEAEPLYREAMSITERNLGTDHPNYSATLGDLAGLLRKQVIAIVMSIFRYCLGSRVAHMHRSSLH